MDEILAVIQSLPPLLVFLIIACIVFLIMYWLWRTVAFTRMKKVLRNLSNDQKQNKALIGERYSEAALLRRSRIIERYARLKGKEIISLLGMDALWIQKLLKRKGKADMLRVLEFTPETGLFSCFLVCLKKKFLFEFLKKWLDKNGHDLFRMKSVALSCRGERFDGRMALELFKDRIDEIRELTADIEWNVRYFAFNLLLYDQEVQSTRALWEALTDTHPLIREIVIAHYNPGEKERFYHILFKTVCDDPAYQVRKLAWERIQKDYYDLYNLDREDLSSDQVFHVLELLKVGNKQEENFAFKFLAHENLELRFMAAQFLEKCSLLDRLFLEVDFSDMEVFNRNIDLLKKASQVNVTSFLACLNKTANKASLTIAASILVEIGDVEFISILARKVFSTYDGSKEMDKLYRLTVQCIAARGTEEALFFYKYELEKRRYQKELMAILLKLIPARAGFIVFDTLFAYFLLPFFEPKEELRLALKRMPTPGLLVKLLDILRSGQGKYPHLIRIESLKLLGELNLFYCLEIALENLTQLPLAEARDYAKVFASYPKELVVGKVERLFTTGDNLLRAMLITVLPAIGHKELGQLVRDCLKDMDPDIRIASVWALIEFNDAKALNAAFEILRDPVLRVREQAALAFGRVGSNSNLEKLKGLVFDEDEAKAVKLAAIKGLGSSPSLKSIDVLFALLDKTNTYNEEIISALAFKKEKEEMLYLIEGFKNGSPRIREAVTAVIKRNGETIEEKMLEFLKQNTHSLRAFIAEILENTGMVESTMRKLKHRDPGIRRQAAEILSLIATPKAYRGIVFAARDPDEEVRIAAVKALEKLKLEDGKKILKDLQEDPDKKVRKFTAWALEKLKVKVN
jgi:HEAT repeat protein